MSNMMCSFIGYTLGFITSFVILLCIRYMPKIKNKSNLKFNNEKEAETYLYGQYGDMMTREVKSYSLEYKTIDTNDDELKEELRQYLSSILMHELAEGEIEFTEEEIQYLSDSVLDNVFYRIIEMSGIFNNKSNYQNAEKIQNNNELNNSTQSNSVNISSALINFYNE